MSARQTVATTIVFDYEYDAMGNPLVNARVEVRLAPSPQPLLQAPLLSLNTQVETVLTDANGYWQLALAPNSGITPAGTYYSVKVAGRTPYLINVPAGGGPVQAISNLVNQPSALATATTNLTGPLTVAGLLTGQAGLTVSAGVVTISALTTGRVLFPLAGGVLSGDAALFWDNAAKALSLGGPLLMTVAASKIRGGATSLGLQNNAANADNLLLTDAGVGTMRNALNIPPSAGGALPTTSYGTLPIKFAEVGPLGAATTPIQFATIPAGFRAIEIRYVLRSTRAAATDELFVRFNADSAANYAREKVTATGTTAPASTESGAANETGCRGCNMPAATAVANFFSHGTIFIPLYASTSGVKIVEIRNYLYQGTAFPAANQLSIETACYIWNSTAAINQVSLLPGNGPNLEIGSFAELWLLP